MTRRDAILSDKLPLEATLFSNFLNLITRIEAAGERPSISLSVIYSLALI